MSDEIRILVIDDNQESCQIITDILDSSGYIVEVAHDGETGLTKVQFSLKQEHPYTLCITDVMLPKLSGIDLLKQVREISPQTGVIVISAFDEVDPFLKKEAVNFGAFRFLPKPIPPGKLVGVVKEYLSSLKIHKGGSSDSTKAKIPFFGTTKKQTQRIDRQTLSHPETPPPGAGTGIDEEVPEVLQHLADAAPPPPPEEQDHITRPVPDASHFQEITDENQIQEGEDLPYKVVKCPMCSKMVKIANDRSTAKIWCSSCGILFDREDAEPVPRGEAERNVTAQQAPPPPVQSPDPALFQTPPPPAIPDTPAVSGTPAPGFPDEAEAPAAFKQDDFGQESFEEQPAEEASFGAASPTITMRSGGFEVPETDTSSDEIELPSSRGRLALDNPVPAVPDTQSPAPQASPLQGAEFRLLLVEDDPHAGEILKTALDVAGLESDIAETGSDAYAMITEGFAQGVPYTLVVSDVMIPGINGLDLMKKVRAEFQGPDFILVSAYEDDQMSLQKQAEMEGALTFFSKPYDYKDMISYITSYKAQR